MLARPARSSRRWTTSGVRERRRPRPRPRAGARPRRAPAGWRLRRRGGYRSGAPKMPSATIRPPFDASRAFPAKFRRDPGAPKERLKDARKRRVRIYPSGMTDESNARVLVVEDDEAIADVLRRSLRAEGHEVKSAGDGAEALTAAEQFTPDLVVLDLGLPRLDGMEVCRRIRADSDVPILMLTARTETEDRVKGLDTGADDYLPKPFERTELLARTRALLRRRPPRGSASIVVGDLLINPDTREVKRGQREIELTNREFELLEYL